MRLLHALNAALVVALVAFSLYIYPELPERIPRHFGAGGTPDAWGDRTLSSWLLLPLIGVGSAALMYVIAALLPTRPHLLNIPDRKKLLELPPGLQQHVLREAAAMLYATAFVMLLMFAAIQYGAYESALSGERSGAVVAGIILGIAGMPLVLVIYMVRIQRRLDEAVRTAGTRGSPTTR